MEENQTPVSPSPSSSSTPFLVKLLGVTLFGIIVLAVGTGGFFLGKKTNEASPTTPPTGGPTPTPLATPVLFAPPAAESPTPTPKATKATSPTPTPVAFSVTSVAAAVSPIASNSCPTTFNFVATVAAKGPGTASYMWERSDGASGQTKTLVFESAGTKTVSDFWTLSLNYTGWKRIKILSPNALVSNKADFTLTCP